MRWGVVGGCTILSVFAVSLLANRFWPSSTSISLDGQNRPTDRQQQPIRDASITSTKPDGQSPSTKSQRQQQDQPAPGAMLDLELMKKELRQQGKLDLEKQWLARIESSRNEVKTYAQGRVIAGRVLLDGPGDPREILAQMEILEDGYFADAIKEVGPAVSFRCDGYEPFDLVLREQPEQPVLCAGVIRLGRVPPQRRAGIKGQLLIPGKHDVSLIDFNMQINTGRTNTPSNGSEPRPFWPKPIQVPVNRDGAFLASGFSPCSYTFEISLPGFVTKSEEIRFLPGSVNDLGVIRLEPALRLKVTSYSSATGSFQGASPREDTVVPGASSARWRADRNSRQFDLEFKQRDGKIVFDAFYYPCEIAKVGKGPIDNYRRIDPATILFVDPSGLEVDSGSVYLFHSRHEREHWALLQVQIAE